MFDLLHYHPMPAWAMLRHNLIHMRDLVIGEFLIFALFGALFLGLLLYLHRRRSYRFRIREQFGAPKQLVREAFNSTRAVFIYNAIQIAMRLVILAFGYILTFDNHLPLWEVALSFPLIIIGHDTYFYWTHRVMHSRALFRLMHWEHHRSKGPTVFTSYSFSMLESVVQGAYPILYVALCPCTFPTLIFFYTVAILHDVTVHSGVDLFPRWAIIGKPFGWICGTIHHDMHHEVGQMNYGLYTRFWDKLMGTEHPKFEAVYDYVHSPQNDGQAYRKVLRAKSAPVAEPMAAPQRAPELVG